MKNFKFKPLCLVLVSVLVLTLFCAWHGVQYLFVVSPQEVVESFKKKQSLLTEEEINNHGKQFVGNFDSYLIYARASEIVYNENSTEQLEELLPQHNFKTTKGYDESCLKIEVGASKELKQLLVIFRGTVPTCSSNLLANLTHGAFGNSALYSDARAFVKKTLTDKRYGSYSVVFTGHSLGGSLAINNGVYFGNSDVYTFNTAFPNSFGVDAAQVNKYLDVEKKLVTRSNVTNLVLEGDEVAGKAMFRFHGLIGETFMLFHTDIAPRKKFNHPISEIVYKLEIASDWDLNKIEQLGRASYVSSIMTF
ncbi:hypothetical protein AB6C44_04175 [Vibrio splendidus]